MNLKLMVFSNSANGHFPEYIHHIYIGISKRSHLSAVFVVPENFKTKLPLFNWPECERISFDYVSDSLLSWGDGTWYKRNYRFTRLLRSYAKKHNPSDILVLDLMLYMPYISFMLPKRIKISGILYEIYQYRWPVLTFPRKLATLVWHWIFAKCKCFKNVFLLNEYTMAEYNNNKYDTQHFRYLPDPFYPLPVPPEDFRDKYKIDKNKKIFFHFGSFGRKKGTIEILKSIYKLSKEEQNIFCFVFAGCIQSVIREEFYQWMEQIRQNTITKILIFDEYCSYDFFAGWCSACDAILVPYLEAYNSSGCIGYAAQFSKPVIGPSYGLLGKLISDYGLGIQIPSINTENLHQAYHKVINTHINGLPYLNQNTVDEFQKFILS